MWITRICNNYVSDHNCDQYNSMKHNPLWNDEQNYTSTINVTTWNTCMYIICSSHKKTECGHFVHNRIVTIQTWPNRNTSLLQLYLNRE